MVTMGFDGHPVEDALIWSLMGLMCHPVETPLYGH